MPQAGAATRYDFPITSFPAVRDLTTGKEVRVMKRRTRVLLTLKISGPITVQVTGFAVLLAALGILMLIL
jgi:hypothetical protein